MEVDLLHGTAVGVALRQGDQLVDLLRVLPHVLGNVQVGENVPDVPHPRVVVMAVAVGVLVMLMLVMVMVMVVGVFVVMVMVVVVEVYILAFLLLPVDGDRHMGAGDAALYRGLGGELHPGDAQAVHAPDKLLRLGMKLQQGGGQHVAGSAHVAFQIQCFHNDAPCKRQKFSRRSAVGAKADKSF